MSDKPAKTRQNPVLTQEKGLALLAHVKKGDIDAVKKDIEGVANIPRDDYMSIRYIEDAIIAAAKGGHADIVKALIKAGANVNAQNEQGSTVLILAAKDGHADIVKALIKAGANVNWEDRVGKTALMSALARGKKDIVKLLINAKAKVRHQDSRGRTILMEAARNGDADITKAILDRGATADLNNQDDLKKRTALMEAVEGGNIDAVNLLINAKAKVNLQDKLGESAFMIAVKSAIGSRSGRTDIAEALLTAGADINVKNIKGETPLIFAACTNSLYAVESLLRAGADIDAKDLKGQTALMRASLYNYIRSVEGLLKKDANVAEKDRGGNTALMLAVDHDGYNDISEDTVKLLLARMLARNVNVNEVNNKGSSALMIAANRRNNQICCKLLLEHGADPTPLYEQGTKNLQEQYLWLKDDCEEYERKNTQVNTANSGAIGSLTQVESFQSPQDSRVNSVAIQDPNSINSIASVVLPSSGSLPTPRPRTNTTTLRLEGELLTAGAQAGPTIDSLSAASLPVSDSSKSPRSGTSVMSLEDTPVSASVSWSTRVRSGSKSASEQVGQRTI